MEEVLKGIRYFEAGFISSRIQLTVLNPLIESVLVFALLRCCKFPVLNPGHFHSHLYDIILRKDGGVCKF